MPHDSAERRHGADSRDAERLAALYDAHAAPVWRYVVHLTGDRAGADDIVQETLLRAWRTPRTTASGMSYRCAAARMPQASICASTGLRFRAISASSLI